MEPVERNLKEQLSELLEKYCQPTEKQRNVILVSSGGIIRLIYRFLFPEKFTSLSNKHELGSIKVKTASVSKVVLDSKEWKIEGWNYRPG